jgi:hypothetical protein
MLLLSSLQAITPRQLPEWTDVCRVEFVNFEKEERSRVGMENYLSPEPVAVGRM